MKREGKRERSVYTELNNEMYLRGSMAVVVAHTRLVRKKVKRERRGICESKLCIVIMHSFSHIRVYGP